MPDPAGERFVCVHGHFYQPPRENPWLDKIEVQDSAAPYHDWNERITAECYAPNAVARLLDADGHITALRNNYERISFNFGPTLHAWMERARPDICAQIRLADEESVRRLGHGNALAQVYGHCIMPLADARDQQTQVRWGIADFEYRYGRRPDGMWLSETAVDRRSLAVLAENGIRFTILAPYQAARVRVTDGQWQDIRDGQIDTTRPYRCDVGGGRTINVFFYDGDISHGIAFAGLLNDGREFARRLITAGEGRGSPQLVHIATDGESYGHHHRFGEMALAAALDVLDHSQVVQLTNYATFLQRFPAQDEVEVRDNTSWSCAHGVERWRADCGCNSGGHPGWQQAWRGPLREALEWLKAQVDGLFERHGAGVLRDPWAARDGYIAVLLRPTDETRNAFLEQHASSHVDGPTRTRIWKLLEMQRHSLLSFTSCGWFFDEPSGIETVQILTYAARALQLTLEFGASLESEFLQRMEAVRSNLPNYRDGRHVYRQLVQPQIVEAARRVADYAMRSLLAPPETEVPLYTSEITSMDRRFEYAPPASFAVGRARLCIPATEEASEYVYAALHLGGHDMHCAVTPDAAVEYGQLSSALFATFSAEPLTELVRRIDDVFGGTFYTLRDIFVDERRRVFAQLTAQAMADCTAEYERMVTNHRRLLDFLAHAQLPMPDELRVATTLVMQRRLERTADAFVATSEPGETVAAVWADARRWNVRPVMDGVRRILETALSRTVVQIATDAETATAQAHSILDLASTLDIELTTREAQNQYYALITAHTDGRWSKSLFDELRRLGERLSFHLREWDRLDQKGSYKLQATS